MVKRSPELKKLPSKPIAVVSVVDALLRASASAVNRLRDGVGRGIVRASAQRWVHTTAHRYKVQKSNPKPSATYRILHTHLQVSVLTVIASFLLKVLFIGRLWEFLLLQNPGVIESIVFTLPSCLENKRERERTYKKAMGFYIASISYV